MNLDIKAVSRVSGITLIEVLVVIAIAAILLGLAVPSFTAFTRAQQVRTTTDLLASSLNEARMRALSQGRTVILCASNDGENCQRGNDWSVGWLMFVVDRQTNVQVPTIDNIVHSHRITARGLSVLASNNFSNRVVYLPSGRVVTTGTFSLCTPRIPLDKTRRIEINLAGYTRVQRLNSLNEVPSCA